MYTLSRHLRTLDTNRHAAVAHCLRNPRHHGCFLVLDETLCQHVTIHIMWMSLYTHTRLWRYDTVYCIHWYAPHTETRRPTALRRRPRAALACLRQHEHQQLGAQWVHCKKRTLEQRMRQVLRRCMRVGIRIHVSPTRSQTSHNTHHTGAPFCSARVVMHSSRAKLGSVSAGSEVRKSASSACVAASPLARVPRSRKRAHCSARCNDSASHSSSCRVCAAFTMRANASTCARSGWSSCSVGMCANWHFVSCAKTPNPQTAYNLAEKRGIQVVCRPPDSAKTQGARAPPNSNTNRQPSPSGQSSKNRIRSAPTRTEPKSE